MTKESFARPMSVRRILLVLSTLLALEAAATTVTLQRGGAAVSGEVCRFRAGDAENPFKRWLASGDVTCAPAGSLAVPRGSWNVFAKADGALSTAPLLIDGDAAPEALVLNLEAAATLIPMLLPKARAVVYVPRFGSAFPASGRALVPSGEALWLIVLQESKAVGVIPIPPIAAGTEHTIDARISAPPAVLGWLRVPESDRAAVRSARGLTTPSVYARAGGTTRDADVLPPLESLHGAFVRIANVSAGDGEIVVQGRGWMTDRRRAKVESALTIVAQPLTLRAVGRLIVRWTTGHDLVALDQSLGACADREPATGVITIAACARPDRPTDPPDPTRCTVIREEPFAPEPKMGEITLDEVPPGVYRAELKFGKKLPPVTSIATVAALQQVWLRLKADWEEVSGTVTHGGELLGEDATLTFPAGYGFVNAETSEYRGVVPAPLGIDAPITIAACDGTPRVTILNEQLHRRSSRLDIDIPANTLTITVEDTFTREPLEGSAIRMEVLSERFPQRPTAASRDLTTGEVEDGESKVVVRSLPERDIVLHVSRAGYQKQTLERFSLTRREEKTIHVQLVPLRGTQGKIASQRPFVDAAIVWFSPTGSEVERADVAPDGTFVYVSAHDANDTMAVVSTSHPLWVSRSPKTPPRETLMLKFPDTTPVRALDVTLTGADARVTRHIGLVIGSVRVPQPVLRQHQTQRNLPPFLRGSGPLSLRDLVETGPFDVILGPETTEVQPRLSILDLFALRPYNELPLVRVPPGATRVELGGR